MTAADQVVEASNDPEVQKEARLWALRMVPQCNVLAYSQNPRVALVDITLLVSGQHREFSDDPSAAKFGSHHTIVREAAHECYQKIWELVADVMPEEDVTLLKEQTNQWLNVHQQEQFLPFQRMVELSELRNPEGEYAKQGRSNRFFREINRNISGTVYELSELNRQIELLSHFAQYSPTYVRWSAESFIYDVLEDGPLGEDIERVSRSLEDLATVSRELPMEQQAVIRQLRDETLAEVENVIDRLFIKTIIFILVLFLLCLLFGAAFYSIRKGAYASEK